MGKDWDNFSGTSKRDGQELKKAAEKEGKWLEGRGTLPYGFGASTPSIKSRDAFIAFLTAIMREALRVLKPGGHALIWALPRTSHWTATALEDAGFEIRDKVYHHFGTGFPKSLDVSKQIDKIAGVEREVIGRMQGTGIRSLQKSMQEHGARKYAKGLSEDLHKDGVSITVPATLEAQQYNGWGTGLKPACEEWILCRKPLAEKNVASNVLKHGTGGLNIDVSRIASQDNLGRMNKLKNGWANHSGGPSRATYDPIAASGRFPANLLLTHTLFCTTDACSAECPVLELDRQSGVRKSVRSARGGVNNNKVYGEYAESTNYDCGYQDKGGASRYFKQFYPPFYYCPKASSSERSSGCEALPGGQGFDKNTSKQIAHINHETGETTYNDYISSINKNNHPTVKSLSLMNYLCNLICPPNGIVLDMFAGSGSTLVAAVQSNMHFIGIEQSSEYVDICNARITWARGEMNG